MLTRIQRWWELRRHPERLLPEPEWHGLCATLPLLAGLGPAELTRLRRLSGGFLLRKALHGAGGLELDPAMQRLVAVQACVPILGLGLSWYAGWYSVLVYPDEFITNHRFEDEAGVVHEAERILSGEAWSRGPVVLSWEHAEASAYGLDWGNVVVHEMAHKLDQLGGEAEGSPPLHRDMSARAWAETFQRAYEDFYERMERDEDTLLDPYAADEPAEFFAVMSEAFFVHPLDLIAEYPSVYAQLAQFYRQDPGARTRSA
jgi:MtfA peptidase